MKTVEEIQRAVELLSAQELVRFRIWLEVFDADRFDAVLMRDAEAGKLDALASEAIVHHRTRQSRDL